MNNKGLDKKGIEILTQSNLNAATMIIIPIARQKIFSDIKDKISIGKLSIKKNFGADKPHDIKVVQREVLHDGSELLIVSVDERKLLLSKTMQNGLNFVTDIEDKQSS